MKYYSSLSPSSPICIELISSVKHLKGSEVAPRGLFQGFLKIKKKQKGYLESAIILRMSSPPSLPLPQKTRDDRDRLNC